MIVFMMSLCCFCRLGLIVFCRCFFNFLVFIILVNNVVVNWLFVFFDLVVFVWDSFMMKFGVLWIYFVLRLGFSSLEKELLEIMLLNYFLEFVVGFEGFNDKLMFERCGSNGLRLDEGEVGRIGYCKKL